MKGGAKLLEMLKRYGRTVVQKGHARGRSAFGVTKTIRPGWDKCDWRKFLINQDISLDKDRVFFSHNRMKTVK